jgi:RNA polymerase sigma-70 factor (ECF subfamily)
MGTTRPAPVQTTDEQLMLEFQRGSRDAFTELFGRYRERIYGFFRRRLDHAARAEELAQETFLAVLRAVGRYEPRALFRTWLYGIAMNLLMAERRKAGREQPQSEAADPPAAENTEAALAVRQAVARLDADDREVLLLREYEQLSYAEIAELLAVPVGTVRSRLFRARMALKELLI